MTVGEVLKKRRTEKRRSIEEIATRLKVSARTLHALEQNAWDTLPSSVYARGYVSKYARYLGINEGQLNTELDVVYQTRRKAPLTLPSIKELGFVITPGSALLIAIAVFLGSIGFYLFFNWINFFAPPSLVLSAPTSDLITHEGEIIINGRTDKGAKLTVNGSTVHPDESGYFEVLRSLQAGLNIIEVRSTNTIGKTSVEVRRILYQQESEAL